MHEIAGAIISITLVMAAVLFRLLLFKDPLGVLPTIWRNTHRGHL